MPAYKYNGGLSVQSDTYTSAYWNRSVPVSLFDTTKTYEVNLYNRVTDFATNEGGFIYNAIRFYNGSTMLSSYDFGRFTYGSGVNKYTFTIPAGTTHVFFEIGLYKCKGGLVSDNFRIKDDQGNTVLLKASTRTAISPTGIITAGRPSPPRTTVSRSPSAPTAPST